MGGRGCFHSLSIDQAIYRSVGIEVSAEKVTLMQIAFVCSNENEFHLVERYNCFPFYRKYNPGITFYMPIGHSAFLYLLANAFSILTSPLFTISVELV